MPNRLHTPQGGGAVPALKQNDLEELSRLADSSTGHTQEMLRRVHQALVEASDLRARATQAVDEARASLGKIFRSSHEQAAVESRFNNIKDSLRQRELV
jgi:hypothetical protein